MERTVTRKQLKILAFLAALSPFLRLIPGAVARQAGAAAWLSPLFAAPWLMILAAFLTQFLNRVCPGKGLGQGILLTLGPKFGAAVLLLWAGWLIFLCGFTLRSGAERFIATIFPNSAPWPMIAIMALLMLPAGLGSVKILARSAEIFRPLLLLTLMLLFAVFLPSVRPEFVLPVLPPDLPGVFRGSLVIADSLCFILLTTAFLTGHSDGQPLRFREFAKWVLLFLLLAFALCLLTVGVLGATVTRQLVYPFFAIVWSLNLFGSAARIEAFVVGLWILPDFVLLSMNLTVASELLMTLFGGEKIPARLLYFRSGGKWVWLCTVLAVVVSVCIAKDTQELSFWSERFVPGVNLTITALIPPILWLTAKRKHLLDP